MEMESWFEVSEEWIEVDFTGHKVWYDHANRQLVLIKKNVYYTVELQIGAMLSSPFNSIHAGNVLDVKFSLCKRYLAIQRSDTEVEIVDIARATEVKLACRNKRGNLVLRGGVLWLQRDVMKNDSISGSSISSSSSSSTADQTASLCLVTRYGLEIYRLPNVEKGELACKLLGTVKHTIQCFWHLPDHHVLLLSTGSGTEMRPYQFQGGYLPTKLAKFILSNTPMHRDIILAKLYDSIYCCEISTSTNRLNLHKLGKETTTMVHGLELNLSGNSLGVSIIDNLICVHDMETKKSFMYDIHAETEKPVTEPLAMFRRIKSTSYKKVTVEIDPGDTIPFMVKETGSGQGVYSSCKLDQSIMVGSNVACRGSYLTRINDDSQEGRDFEDIVRDLDTLPRPLCLTFQVPIEENVAATSTEEGGDGTAAVKAEELLYCPSWVFLMPCWILDAKRGRIWKIMLNLDSIAKYGGSLLGNGKVNEASHKTFLIRDPRRLYSFLLRRACIPPANSKIPLLFGSSKRDERAYSKAVLLHYIRSMIVREDVDMESIAMAFKLINEAYLKALRERASTPVGASSQQRQQQSNNSSSSSSTTTGSTPSSDQTGESSSGASSSSSSGEKKSSSGNISPVSSLSAKFVGRSLLPRQSSDQGKKDNSLLSSYTSAKKFIKRKPPTPAFLLDAAKRMNKSGRKLKLHNDERSGERSELEGHREEKADGTSDDLDSSQSTTSSQRHSTVPVGAGGEIERENLRQMLEEFENAGQIPLKDIRCYNGLSVVLQIDILTWVFMPAIPDDYHSHEGKMICERLGFYLCQYIRSLLSHYIPIEKYIHELLAWFFITSENEHILQQLLQYHVPSDSKRLARTLLESSDTYEPFGQVALDMMYRLGHNDSIVLALLNHDQLLPALHVLQRHPTFLQTEHASFSQEALEQEKMQDQHVASSSPNRTSAKLPVGTVLIRPSWLFECAVRIYSGEVEKSSRNGKREVFTALHSFFVSIDPWLISCETIIDSSGESMTKYCSPLARQVGDFPNELFQDSEKYDTEEIEMIKSAFGFLKM